jgi:AcrR family transcriptional regulator
MVTAKSSTRKTRRGPGRLTAADAELLEGRLLGAAERVFIEQGYAGATMDAIAKAAAASRKTIYARYANKAEVMTAVVNRLLDAAMNPHQKGVRPLSVGRDPEALLLQIARELASLSEAPHVAGINRLVFAEALQAPDLARLFLDLHARAAEDVRANLEELRDEGSLPRLPNSRWAAVIFIEMVASVPRMRALLGAPLSRKEINELTAAAVEIFLRGCGKT